MKPSTCWPRLSELVFACRKSLRPRAVRRFCRGACIEALEPRRLLSVTLGYAGPGTGLLLTESAPGADSVTISQVSDTDLRINLLNGAVFSGLTPTFAPGLSFQSGNPTTSTFADINISAINSISTLQSRLDGDVLDLGSITNVSGGISNIDLAAGAISVDVLASISTTAAEAGAGDITLRADTQLTINSSAFLQAGNGSINLFGNQDGRSGNFFGIFISGARVTTSGAGNISLHGTGSNDITTGTHAGVFLTGAADIEADGSGGVSIAGAGGMGTGNDLGVSIDATLVISSGRPLNITGVGDTGISVTDGAQLQGSGTVSLAADSMSFDPTVTLQANRLIIAPLTPGLPIDIGGALLPGTLSLFNFPGTLLSNVLQLGSASTGPITISAPSSFGSVPPVTLVLVSSSNITEQPAGTIQGNSFLAVRAGGQVALNSPGNLLGNIAADALGAVSISSVTSIAVESVDGIDGISAGGNVSLSASSITLVSPITTPATVDLSAGQIAQLGFSPITADALRLTGGTMTLASPNAVNTLAAKATGPVNFSNNTDLLIGAVHNTAGITLFNSSLTLSTPGDLIIDAPINAGTGVFSFNAGGTVYNYGQLGPIAYSNSATLHGIENTAATGLTLATFTDSGGVLPISSYSATVNWGDGTPAQLDTAITFNPLNGRFTVTGSHTYATLGTYQPTVVIHRGGAPNSNTITDSVAIDGIPLTTKSASLTFVEGKPATVTVGSFSTKNTAARASDFTADIDWLGDGHPTSGTIIKDGPGKFHVTGTFTYFQLSPTGTAYAIIATIHRTGASDTVIHSRAGVADAPLDLLTPLSPTAAVNQSTNFPLATFRDQNSGASSPSQYAGTIDWGDGTSSVLTFAFESSTPNVGSFFQISASHTYTTHKSFKATIKFHDLDSPTKTYTLTELIAVS